MPEAVEKLFEKYGSPLLRPDPTMKRMSQRKEIGLQEKRANEVTWGFFEGTQKNPGLQFKI